MVRRTVIPWREGSMRPLEDLYKEMDNIVQHFLGDQPANGDKFAPLVNVGETESGYEVSIDLPGINPDNVSLELQDDQLVVSGTKESEVKEEGKTFHRIERRYGEFRRVIPMPLAVDENSITANYEDGVLMVMLPKSEKVRPTKIQITKK